MKTLEFVKRVSGENEVKTMKSPLGNTYIWFDEDFGVGFGLSHSIPKDSFMLTPILYGLNPETFFSEFRDIDDISKVMAKKKKMLKDIWHGDKESSRKFFNQQFSEELISTVNGSYKLNLIASEFAERLIKEFELADSFRHQTAYVTPNEFIAHFVSVKEANPTIFTLIVSESDVKLYTYGERSLTGTYEPKVMPADELKTINLSEINFGVEDINAYKKFAQGLCDKYGAMKTSFAGSF